MECQRNSFQAPKTVKRSTVVANAIERKTSLLGSLSRSVTTRCNLVSAMSSVSSLTNTNYNAPMTKHPSGQ